MSEAIQLTDYALCGGCAAKVAPKDLRAMLGRLTPARDARVLVDMSTADDAGVLAIDKRRALVHTIDVVTPIIDAPRAFGRVVAANAVSDVYAMGGVPTSAVALLGVPAELPKAAVPLMLRGAQALLREAGAPLIGGHTVKDKELKLGFAVTGTVELRRLVTNAAARAGQRLVLSKRLGTGVLYQAMKAGLRTPAETRSLIASMTRLNAGARDAMWAHRVRCGTDVTGFGLIGHALNIARGSGVDLVISAAALPALPGVLGYLERNIHPPTTRTNLEGYGRDFVRDAGVREAAVLLAADPQTSGGLLMATEARRAEALARAVHGWVIGEVRAPSGRRPRVRLFA